MPDKGTDSVGAGVIVGEGVDVEDGTGVMIEVAVGVLVGVGVAAGVAWLHPLNKNMIKQEKRNVFFIRTKIS